MEYFLLDTLNILQCFMVDLKSPVNCAYQTNILNKLWDDDWSSDIHLAERILHNNASVRWIHKMLSSL